LKEEDNQNLKNNLGEPKSGSGFLNSDSQSKAGQASDNGTGIISLAQAATLSGYHQIYLGYLCRNGKLKGFKVGRNWVTTKEALAEFQAANKNGSSEITDENGNLMPVLSSEAITPQVSVKNTEEKIKNNSGVSIPVTVKLSHLKTEVFENLEEKIQKLDKSLNELTEKNKALEQNQILNSKAVLQPSVKVVSSAPVSQTPEVNVSELSDEAIHKKTKAKILDVLEYKELLQKFEPKRKPYGIFATAAVFALALILFVYKALPLVNTAIKTPSVVNQTQNNYNITNNNQKTYTNTNNTQVVLKGDTVEKVLGLDQSKIFNLIDDRLNEYLKEGKFKGEKGDTGLQGPAGANGSGGTIPSL
jgi:hypothetical protein